MGGILYFAYGSNMLTARLKARCQSATPVGAAEADGFSIAFSKPSKDGSGKATLVKSSEKGRALGVVFEIDDSELRALDRAEGARFGYERIERFPVRLLSGNRTVLTTTYLASQAKEALNPYCWYLALIIAGACEHGLDEDYIDRLRQIVFDVDHDEHRKGRVEAVAALTSAACADYMVLLTNAPASA